MRKNQKIFLALWTVLTVFFVSCAYNLKGITLLTNNKTVEKASKELHSTADFQQILRLIAKSLKPSVVNIQVVMKPTITSSTGDRTMDELLKRFFGRDFGGSSPDEGQGGNALGSGFIVSKDGYIVTNAHVVRNAKTITVTLEDQASYTADLIGIDSKTDVAILKIHPKKPLVAAPLGNSDTIEAGDFAVAIGNPFGLTGTLTFGIISAKGRNNFIEENAAYKNYIQTDVPINPGNSGGPLINIEGQVIGMNSAIYSTSGGSIGIGFAIPINIVRNVIQQLIQSGHVTRGTIGVLMGPVSKDIANAYHRPSVKGVLVNEVLKNSPAQRAGLQIWDVITAVNGATVEDPGDFIGKISSFAPGQKVILTVMRDGGKQIKIPIVIGKNKDEVDSAEKTNNEEDEGSSSATQLDWQGMSLIPMQNAKAQGLSLPPGISGIVVLDIKPSSKVIAAGIAPGDVIVSINKTPVKNLSDVKRLTKNHKFNYVQFYSRQFGRNVLLVLP